VDKKWTPVLAVVLYTNIITLLIIVIIIILFFWTLYIPFKFEVYYLRHSFSYYVAMAMITKWSYDTMRLHIIYLLYI